MRDLINRLFNWLFCKLAGIEINECYLCGMYRFGNWVEARYVTAEQYYTRIFPEKKQHKRVWLCLRCRENTPPS